MQSRDKRRENEGSRVVDYKDYVVFFGREGRNTVTTRLLEQKDLGRTAHVNRASLQFALGSSYASRFNPQKFLPGELDDNELVIRSTLKGRGIKNRTASDFWDSYWYSAGKAVYTMILGSIQST